MWYAFCIFTFYLIHSGYIPKVSLANKLLFIGLTNRAPHLLIASLEAKILTFKFWGDLIIQNWPIVFMISLLVNGGSGSPWAQIPDPYYFNGVSQIRKIRLTKWMDRELLLSILAKIRCTYLYRVSDQAISV